MAPVESDGEMDGDGSMRGHSMSYRTIGCSMLITTFSCTHAQPERNRRASAIAIAVLDYSTEASGQAAPAVGKRVADDLDREVTQRPGSYLSIMQAGPLQRGLSIQRCQVAGPALVRDSLPYARCASGCELVAARQSTIDFLLMADILSIEGNIISLGRKLIDVQRGLVVAQASKDCSEEELDAAIAGMTSSLMNN